MSASTLFPRRTRQASVVLGLGLVLSACSTVSSLWSPESQTEDVTLVAAPDANNDFPVAVDLVAVTEAEFAQALAETPARTWFQQRESFLSNNANLIDVKSFELVPGQTMDEISYSWGDRRSYSAIFVFANFMQSGTHRARIDQIDAPTIILGSNTLKLESRD